MLCGTVPFKAQSMHELHHIIQSGSFEYPYNLVHVLSLEARDLINRMLIVNPKERISISEILKHPWIQLYDCILDE
jgi:serine/threonine protein kinase